MVSQREHLKETGWSGLEDRFDQFDGSYMFRVSLQTAEQSEYRHAVGHARHFFRHFYIRGSKTQTEDTEHLAQPSHPIANAGTGARNIGMPRCKCVVARDSRD